MFLRGIVRVRSRRPHAQHGDAPETSLAGVSARSSETRVASGPTPLREKAYMKSRKQLALFMTFHYMPGIVVGIDQW